MLCCDHLDSLNNLILEHVFCKWSPMGQEAMSMGRGDAHSPLPSQCHKVFEMSWAENSTEVKFHQSEIPPAKLKVSTRKASCVSSWVSRHAGSTTLALRTGMCFGWGKLAGTLWGSWTTQKPSISSYSCQCHALARYSCCKWWHRRKGKDRDSHSFFSFQPVLTNQ